MYMKDLDIVCDAILDDAWKVDFCGYDPFDALSSSFFKKARLDKFSGFQIAWLQFHKRSPLNFRRFVGVPLKRNPKGIALFIMGLIERFRVTQSDKYLLLANELAEWLLSERVDQQTWNHHAWGYHFDWAARAFFVPKGKPNAITTCYVARAMRSLGAVTGNTRLTEVANDAGYFLDGLYVQSEKGGYYAYIPGEEAFVHNASLWSAAVVAQTAADCCDNSLRERALSVARLSIGDQANDGSWPYGSRAHHSFIDGFHTGYNLEALSELQIALGVSDFSKNIDRGLEFYRNNFFEEDGTVKYYADCTWPLDTHSVSQAVLTLLKLGDGATDLEIVNRVLHRAMETLYLSSERRFVYQVTRLSKNKINYLRWTQAWAFYALSYYISYNSSK
jgi:polysaccharide biosynthesis protein VpsJ